MTEHAECVVMVPVAGMTVLNPRARNRRKFADLVESVASVGLKKPVTVRLHPGSTTYDLVCGQGRLEAFIQLRQTEIPAFVIVASDEDCYVLSLVENLARRQHPPLELLAEIEALRARGYAPARVAELTGLSPEYIYAISSLFAKGEHRLLKAVERGIVPCSVAIEISRADDAEVQTALREAYESKSLPGNQVTAIRRIIDQRRRMKGRDRTNDAPKSGRVISGDSLVRAYKREMERQKRQVQKAELAQNRLLFLVNALRNLLAEDHFCTLLRAEALPTMPKLLHERVTAEQ